MLDGRFEEELYEFEKVKLKKLIFALVTITIATFFSFFSLIISITNNAIFRNFKDLDVIPYGYNFWEEK